MGFSGISVTELLVIMAIVLLLSGSRKLSGLGSDLGAAVRGFRKAMAQDTPTASAPNAAGSEQSSTGDHPQQASRNGPNAPKD